MSEAALQCISDIHPDWQWMASRWWLWSPLCGCQSGEDCHCYDPGSDCIPGAWPAVLHDRCCSQVVGLGPSPPQHQATGQLPGLLPNSLLQNVKVALRVQPPPVTGRGLLESRSQTVFSLAPDSKGKGESQKYKAQISLKRWNLIFQINFVAHLHHICLHRTSFIVEHKKSKVQLNRMMVMCQISDYCFFNLIEIYRSF